MKDHIKRFMFMIFLGVLVGIPLGLFLAKNNISLPKPSALHIVAFFLFFYPIIYIHEFGHALAGMIAGFSIKRITIGTGRPIYKKTIGQCQLIITNGFSGGFTFLGDTSEKYLQLRFLIFILGGVLGQGIVIAILMAIYNMAPRDLIHIQQLTFAHVFIFSNLNLIVFNLIPHRINMGGIKIANDGLNILKAPFFKPREIQTILSAGKIMEGYERIEEKQFDQAEVIFQTCAEQYPDALIPKANLSIALIKQLKLDEAQDVLESAIETHAKDPLLFFVLNNLAWIYLLRLDEGTLALGVDYAQQAFKSNPRAPFIQSTKATLLIEQGHVKEGVALLKKCTKRNRPIDEKTNAFTNVLYMAYGLFQAGDADQAFKYVNKFEAYDKTLDEDEHLLTDHVIERTQNFGRTILK